MKVTWGDSVKTIVDFHARFPNVSCDVISIDGGHTTKVASSDFMNFKQMASCRHLILFDNYPQKQFKLELGKVWETKKRSGELVELFQCTHLTCDYGFSVGKYRNLEKCKKL